VTFWHIDERDEAGTPSGWGVNLSASTQLGERWMPFLRAGWTQDGGSLLDRSVTAGFGYQAFEGRDQLGVAVNWGRPNKDGFGPGLDDQWSFEIFYRWQIFRALAVTPSLQLLLDAALHPDESSLFMLGLRVRWAL
jgi:porin